VLADNAFTLVHRQNGAKHPLVSCMGLAKVQGWHTSQSSANS
jgi:hypothetical protein